MGRKKKLQNIVDEDELDIERRARIVTLELQEEKLRSQRLENSKRERDLEERAGSMCYITTALSEFNRALSIFVEEVKQLPVDLQHIIGLSPDQYLQVEEMARDLINRLHNNIKLNLESTVDLKARASQSTAKTSAQAQKVRAKTLTKGGKK